MRKLALFAPLAALAFFAPVDTADAKTVCKERGEMIKILSRKFNEHQRSFGLQNDRRVLELYASADGTWTAVGVPVDPDRTYLVGVNDFLVSGRESGLGFLDVSGPDLTEVGRHGDVRRALIDALLRAYE